MELLKKRVFSLWSLVLVALLFGWSGCAEEETPTVEVVQLHGDLAVYCHTSVLTDLGDLYAVLTDDKGNSNQYPRETDNFPLGREPQHLIIFISDLAPGEYTLTFASRRKNVDLCLPASQVIRVAAGETTVVENIFNLPDRVEPQVAVSYPVPMNEVVALDPVTTVDVVDNTEMYAPQGMFSISSNKEQNWALFRDGDMILDGKGNLKEMSLLAGNYHFEAESLHGHAVEVLPASEFTINADEPVVVNVLYKETYGDVSVNPEVSGKIPFNVMFTPVDGGEKLGDSIQFNHLVLENARLPTGRYQVSYDLPSIYKTVGMQEIKVVEGEVISLNPVLQERDGDLAIYCHTPVLADLEGIYVTVSDGEKVVAEYPKVTDIFPRGKDPQHRIIFVPTLTSGTYTITFASRRGNIGASLPESQLVTVASGETTVIKQMFNLRDIGTDVLLASESEGHPEQMTSQEDVPTVEQLMESDVATVSPSIDMPLMSVFSLNNNRERGWMLLGDDGKVVIKGKGSVQGEPLLPGNYQLEVEPIHGHTVDVEPASLFTLSAEKPVTANVFYEEAYGKISVETEALGNPSLNIILFPLGQDGRIVKALVDTQNNRIFWENGDVPVGKYRVSYQLPQMYNPVEAEEVVVCKGETINLNPQITGFKESYAVSNETMIQPTDLEVPGDLAIYCETPVLADLGGIYVTVSDSEGVVAEYPKATDSLTQRQDPQHRIIFIPSLLSGTYTVSFSNRQKNTGLALPEPQVVTIAPEKTTVVEHVFNLMDGGIDVQVAFKSEVTPKVFPQIQVLDDRGQVVAQSQEGFLKNEKLSPQRYTVVCEQLPGYRTPEPISAIVMPGVVAGPFRPMYEDARGELHVVYGTDARETRLDAIGFSLISPEGERINYPNGKGFTYDPEKHTRTVAVSGLLSGVYRIEFMIPNNDGLFEEVEGREVEVTQEAVSTVEQIVVPKFAAVSARVDMSDFQGGSIAMPSISIYDEQGTLVAESDSGDLQYDHLLPGSYVLKFQQISDAGECPQEQYFTVAPGAFVGPVSGVYTAPILPSILYEEVEPVHEEEVEVVAQVPIVASSLPEVIVHEEVYGELRVVYGTGVDELRLDAVRFWLTASNGERVLYPIGSDFTYDSQAHTRTVSIPKLASGSYRIDFLLPNADKFFNETNVKDVEITQGDVCTVEQMVSPNFATVRAVVDISDIQDGSVEMPFMRIYDHRGKLVVESKTGNIQYSSLLPGSYTLMFQPLAKGVSPPEQYFKAAPGAVVGPFYGNYGAPKALFSLSSNMEQHWDLLCDGKTVISGKGGVEGERLPLGNYVLQVQPIHGYTVNISPGTAFALNAEKPLIAVVTYKEAFGEVSLDTTGLGNPVLEMTLAPIDENGSPGNPIEARVCMQDKHLIWKNAHLPVGRYQVSYQLPSTYQPVAAQEIIVNENETVHLNPVIKGLRSLHVTTNKPEAEYALDTASGEALAVGKGAAFSFDGLIPGEYKVVFHSLGDDYAIPQAHTVIIPKEQDIAISGTYRLLGLLDLSANVSSFRAHILSMEDKQAFDQEVGEGGKVLALPAGRYRLDFLPLTGNLSARYGDDVPNSVEFIVVGGKTEKIRGLYEARQGSLVVTSNLPQAGYTVRDVTLPKTPVTVGHFQGEYTIVPFTYVGRYEVVFDEIYNFRTPNTVVVDIGDKERKAVGGSYLTQEKIAVVHAGPAIIGDVFGDGAVDERPSRTVDLSTYSVGINLVTNEQFAGWLTRALRSKRIQYVRDTMMRGQVVDLEGRLLFETFLADKDSQIRLEMDGDQWAFNPIEGKEQYPVVEVSWYGAMMYCKDNGFRLPTEAEWERAASMASVQPGAPLKKYRYGFGRDDIDPTWANYLETFNPLQSREVMTRSVGFYDGTNLLEYTSELEADTRRDPMLMNTRYGTKDARSPVGCYDMSGNVREWVADWYGEDYYRYMPSRNPQGPAYGVKKVTKGGSYNSFAFELRTSARMPLSPETTDAFTGFRVAVDSAD